MQGSQRRDEQRCKRQAGARAEPSSLSFAGFSFLESLCHSSSPEMATCKEEEETLRLAQVAGLRRGSWDFGGRGRTGKIASHLEGRMETKKKVE